MCLTVCVCFCGPSVEGESVGLCESGNSKYLEEFSVHRESVFKVCISEYYVRLMFSQTGVFGAQLHGFYVCLCLCKNVHLSLHYVLQNGICPLLCPTCVKSV